MAGVEGASALESLSAEEGRTAGTSVEESGEECSLALSFWAEIEVLRSEELSTKDCSASGASFSVTTRLLEVFLAPAALLARPPVEELAAGMAGGVAGKRPQES